MNSLREAKMCISDLPDEFYKGKKVFVRVDLNLSTNDKDAKTSEDYRIRRTISTLDFLVKRGARVILGSHSGRPGGKFVDELSLNPIATRLSQVLRAKEVKFVNDCIGKEVEYQISRLYDGEVLLLENLRFHRGETENDKTFAKQLSSLAEVYVNDAFSTSHRKHASTYGVSKYFKYKLAGFTVEKEIDSLDRIKLNPKRPFTLVVGGVKIKDKISALKDLIKKADKVLIGGVLAYYFLAAKGLSVGKTELDPDSLKWAKRLLTKNVKKLYLPSDHIVAKGKDRRSNVRVVKMQIPNGFYGFDIGPKTTSDYTDLIMNAEGTIFWNGPMGLFEVDEFSHGTTDIARAISIAYWRGAYTVVGGGDTTVALRKAGVLETEVDYVSTGGGATLEYLSGAELPGISILNNKESLNYKTA